MSTIPSVPATIPTLPAQIVSNLCSCISSIHRIAESDARCAAALQAIKVQVEIKDIYRETQTKDIKTQMEVCHDMVSATLKSSKLTGAQKRDFFIAQYKHIDDLKVSICQLPSGSKQYELPEAR